MSRELFCAFTSFYSFVNEKQQAKHIMVLWSHLGNNYSLAMGDVLEIKSNEVFYFLLPCTILPIINMLSVAQNIWGQLRVKARKPTYQLVCIYSRQLIRSFLGRICYHNQKICASVYFLGLGYDY